MRKAGWTPSIVKDEDDQNVYIVLDDFGRNGRAPTAKRSSSAPTSKQSSWTCWKANTNNPVRVVAFNTAEKWRRTFRLTLPTSLDGAATCSFAMCRSILKSSSVTKAAITMSGCRFRS